MVLCLWLKVTFKVKRSKLRSNSWKGGPIFFSRNTNIIVVAKRLISYFWLDTMFLFLPIVLECFTVAMERHQRLSNVSQSPFHTIPSPLTPLQHPLTLTHFIFRPLAPPHHALFTTYNLLRHSHRTLPSVRRPLCICVGFWLLLIVNEGLSITL